MSSSSRARSAAEEWIKTLGLPAKIKGTTIDLREPAKALDYQGRFRSMVLRAAARELTTRGASSILPDDLD